MEQSLIMQDFASGMVAKASTKSPAMSSMIRNSSDLSLSDIGDDKCFNLTKALGYHVIYGKSKLWLCNNLAYVHCAYFKQLKF